jgi:hypothetical protein
MDEIKKTNELLEQWYDDNVVEDQAECMQIGGMAQDRILSHLNIDIAPKSCLAFYSIVFEEIIKALAAKRADEDEFVINIANIVKIGYNNVKDDGNYEVVGNFNIVIQDVGKTPKFTEDSMLTSLERCTEWMSMNVNEQPKLINTISTAAIKSLFDKVQLHLGQPECVFPIWSLIHLSLVDFVKVSRTEKNESDYFINFCNNFEIHAQLAENKDVIITYKPNIAEKLNIKSNLLATSTHE